MMVLRRANFKQLLCRILLMRNLFDEDAYESAIITREEVLRPDFLPDELLYRDAELKAIADAVKPLLKKSDCENLLIHGKSGTGKTSCIRSVMKQLSDHSPVVLPVYINCWETPTKVAVFNKVIEAMELPLPRRGIAADEAFSKIIQFMKNYSKPVLLVLDELDGLAHDDLLYIVARANEKPGIVFGIVGISNNPAFLSKLDARIRSSLRFSEMQFREYSEDQLFHILKDRASIGLLDGSYDEKLLQKIAREVTDGSARMALERLWKSAKHAENAGKGRITLQDLADSEADVAMRPGAKVTDIESMIIERLRSGEKDTNELFEALGADKSKRQFMNYLAQLERKGIILMEGQDVKGGESFRPKVCRLKI